MSKNVLKVFLENQLETSYLSYAMSVIVNRAIPDVRDGLKPVHRRILFSMYENGFFYNKGFKKSARVVGDVVGKYHPHGDKAIYDSLVRMAQKFSLLHVLIEGQGNFGSVDGDPAAAMRYTEVKLSLISKALLSDIDKKTVDFKPNYDGLELEPSVLPSAFPNILVNGVNGVAVGMATNIPCHNLTEVINLCIARLSKRVVSIDEALKILPGPDFPTGGIILNISGIKDAFSSGKGSIVLRAKTHFETNKNNRDIIVVDEIPYQVNKSKLIENIALLVRDKKLEGISDIKDESDKSGIRISIDIKKGFDKEVILNNLINHTALQIRYHINMMLLDKMQPKLMNIIEIIDAFLEHRKEIIVRRITYLLSKAREKANVLLSLYIAILNIDEVVNIIRHADSKDNANFLLVSKKWNIDDDIKSFISKISNIDIEVNVYNLTSVQADYILNMKLSSLTKLEKDKLSTEINLLISKIDEYIEILKSQNKIDNIIIDEFEDLITNFHADRKTIIDRDTVYNIGDEDLIPNDEVVVSFTFAGYIKRVLLDNYKSQKRGGKGKIAQSIREEDHVRDVFVTSNHSEILFFSDKAKVYRLKAYKIPQVDPHAKGRAVANLLNIGDNEKITIVMPLDKKLLTNNDQILFVTSKGKIKRNMFADYSYIPLNGKLAMSLEEDDKLVSVLLCNNDNDILLSTSNGKSIRFEVDNVRLFKGRVASGVKAINLSPNDKVITCAILERHNLNNTEKDKYLRIPYKTRRKILSNPQYIEKIDTDLPKDVILDYVRKEQFILTVTENGYGKITSFYEYNTIKRGGSGVVSIITSKRNGKVIESCVIEPGQHVLLVTDGGQLIRINTGELPCISRNTQGVIILRTKIKEKVVAVAKIIVDNDEIDITN